MLTFKQVLNHISAGTEGEMDSFCAASNPVAHITNSEIETPNFGIAKIFEVEGGFLVRVYDENGDSNDFACAALDEAQKIATEELYNVTADYN